MNTEVKDGYEFVAIHYPFYINNAIRITENGKSLDSYCEYIRKHKISKAEVILPDLTLLSRCPDLKHLKIVPAANSDSFFDFSPLYDMPQVISLNCENQYGCKKQYTGIIDYSRIHGLLDLTVSVNKGTLNFNHLETLRSLCIGGFTGNDISDMFCSKKLDTLRMIGCKSKSLDGIGNSYNMQCLYLLHNHVLQDITALKDVKETLKAVRIVNCPKITDFSILSQLHNLETLELSGSNTLPNLSFLRELKNLKTFIFNVNVLDGDLSPCLALPYVYSEKNRRHYNLKDTAFRKELYVHGNENIEEWRRLE